MSALPQETGRPVTPASGVAHDPPCIVALAAHESRTQNFLAEFRRRGYQVYDFEDTSFSSLRKNFFAYLRACRRSRLVLSGTAFPWLVVWLLIGRLLGRPVLLDYPMDSLAWPFGVGPRARVAVAIAVRVATALVTIRSRSYLTSKLGINERRVLFVESCPDDTTIGAVGQAKSRFHSAPGDFVICCSGGHEHHRQERFIAIFEALVPIMPSAFLLVISDPSKPIARRALQWASANGKESRVQVLPVIKPVEDFFATVACCHLWVATMGDDTLQGRHEFRMELLEVGLIGKAVVSAATPGLMTHELKDGEEILFIDPADPAASALKIAELANSPGALERMGSKLEERIRTEFSLREAVDQLEKFAR